MKDLKLELANWPGRKVLMAIYPHPDDETMAAGGLLLAARQMGWETVVVILTRGGAGQIHINAGGKSLKTIRTKELGKATKLLGVSHLEVGDFDDGKVKVQKSKWLRWLQELILKYNPSWFVSYDPSGISGHPDHISLSLEVKKVVPEKSVLLWTTLPSNLAKRLVNPKEYDFVTKPDYQLNLGWNWIKKWQAARSHASQALGKSMPVPLGLVFMRYPYEWYHKVNLNQSYKHKFIEFKI